MSVTVTLDLPEHLAEQAERFAKAKRLPLSDLLTDWIGDAVRTQSLSDLEGAEIIRLSELTLHAQQQERQGELLESKRESRLSASDAEELNGLMTVYRNGLILKAKAVKEAVQRGLAGDSNLLLDHSNLRPSSINSLLASTR